MAHIHWFRNDLRVHDNPAFTAAAEQETPLLAVYVFDPRCWQQDEWGIERTGSYRAQFLLESLAELKRDLEALGGTLVTLHGNPEEVLPALAEEVSATAIFAQAGYGSEERAIEAQLQRMLPLHLYHGSTLIHPSDLPFPIQDLPEVFTEFRKAVEKRVSMRPEHKAPSAVSWLEMEPQELPNIHALGIPSMQADTRAPFQFSGGRSLGLQRVHSYFWESEALSTYKATRNGMLHANDSSRLSPWLANGCLSPREVYWAVKRYEAEVKSNSSTYWLVFELLWRDYFQFVAMKRGDRLFWPSGIRGRKKEWGGSEADFERWKNGQTGDPLVDANQNELRLTGWMSNRGRQNAASYLVHDLGVDWRKGAAWFESQLIDYDPASNYGNWQYAAGVGNDPRPNRKFNTKLQAERYDPDGAYRKRWAHE